MAYSIGDEIVIVKPVLNTKWYTMITIDKNGNVVKKVIEGSKNGPKVWINTIPFRELFLVLRRYKENLYMKYQERYRKMAYRTPLLKT